MQEKEHGLKQDLARDIIASANDYLTRDDPNGPIARLDDRLRVTVVGELVPSNGIVKTRLERLVMGTVVVDGGFEGFLDTPTVDRLVRRDYYWRDETLEVFNNHLSALVAESVAGNVQRGREWEHVGGGGVVPQARVALDESSVRIGEATSLYMGLGNEDFSLLDASYGRARIGISRSGLRAWGEVPAPVGNASSPLLARALNGRVGFGMSFESKWLGGTVCGTIGSSAVGAPAASNGERYVLDKGAIVFGIIPLPAPFLRSGAVRLRAGVGYWSVDNGTPNEPPPNTDIPANHGIVPSVRVDVHATDASVHPTVRGSIGLFDQSLSATCEVWVAGGFAVRVAAARHGLFGRQSPWLPDYSISISPTFTVW